MARSWFSVLILAWALPSMAVGLPATENAHGIIVKFRSAAKNTFRHRDQLHAQLGNQLVYRPRRSPYDFVLPKEEKVQHDFDALTKLCQSYQTASVVAECEINYELLTRNEPSLQTCSLTPNQETPLLRGGTLSPFWAQEMIGTDLVAFPRQRVQTGFAVRVAVLDQDFHGKTPQAHGALTLGLLTGPTPFSVQAPLEISHRFEVRSTIDYLKVLDAIEEAKQPPAIVQISVDLGGSSNAAQDAFERISKKAVLVAAAGNHWPAPLARNEKRFPGILVGSLSPEGYPSDTSALGTSITIQVPSDHYLQSTADGKTARTFGGTSGASALLTGVLAAAKSLVPDLAMKESKTLLARTALPNGSLNAVRFLAVVDRLRSQSLLGKTRDKAIAANRLYDFSLEAQVEFQKAAPVLADSKAGCDQSKQAFNQLRRAYFLSPGGKAREMLATLFAEQQLTSNARFIENQDRALLMKHLAEDTVSSDPATRISAARAAATVGVGGVDMLVQFAHSAERDPASEDAQINAVLKGLVASMDDPTRKDFQNRLRASEKETLKKLAEKIF